MSSIDKKAAEILVECGYAEAGYADYPHIRPNPDGSSWVKKIKAINHWTSVDIFADTLEGRRQADAIEDWLRTGDVSVNVVWLSSEWNSEYKHEPGTIDSHRWRLDRIKWCLEQLIKTEEEK